MFQSKYFFIVLFTTISLVSFFFFYSDMEYRKADRFISNNIVHHKSAKKILVDARGNYTHFSPYTYSTLYEALQALDSFQNDHALVTIIEEDNWQLTDKFLHLHIDRSLETWKRSPFRNHIDFQNFLNFVLPYRAGNEVISIDFDSITTIFSDSFDRARKASSPVWAATIINADLKNMLEFDLRSHADINNLGIMDVLAQKKGSCASLTQTTAMIMRCVGIAVAIDECPVWGHRNSGHQWNAVLNNDGKWVPFGGAETNPDEFDAINDSIRAPKIFRHTYSYKKNFGPDITDKMNIPPIFHSKNRIDVTSEYVSTSKVFLDNLKNAGYVYLSVFNSDQWQIVDFAEVKNGMASFKQIGDNNIVYLPVYFTNGKVISASSPFILSKGGKKIGINPGKLKQITELQYYNMFFDIKWNIGIPQEGWKMELFYWDNEWISCGIDTVDKTSMLEYRNVPTEALYLIRSHDWENTWQRIFTIENGEQIWY